MVIEKEKVKIKYINDYKYPKMFINYHVLGYNIHENRYSIKI